MSMTQQGPAGRQTPFPRFENLYDRRSDLRPEAMTRRTREGALTALC